MFFHRILFSISLHLFGASRLSEVIILANLYFYVNYFFKYFSFFIFTFYSNRELRTAVLKLEIC